MFTLEQIKAAHSKVKSGADFPGYVQDLKNLGVQFYEHYLADGHIDYRGADAFTISAPAKWEARHIATQADEIQLRQHLKFHQRGGTDYMTFCAQAADAGVEQWVVDINAMTCTYYDTAGNNMLEEMIPNP